MKVFILIFLLPLADLAIFLAFQDVFFSPAFALLLQLFTFDVQK